MKRRGSNRERIIAGLFQAEYPRLVRLAYLITSDSRVAEELAQESFVRLWRSWGQIRSEQALPRYLQTTVVNLARTNLRRRALEIRHSRNETLGRKTASTNDTVESSMDMSAAIDTLPAGKKACVVLRYYLDLSEQETADVLGISLGAVKSQTHKAIALLRKRMGSSEVEWQERQASDARR